MDILQYLIALLKIQKEIGIEGLGTFIKTKTPGRYDTESHSFIPPASQLSFSNQVVDRDILCQFIQSERGITESSARYFIQQFVEEVKREVIKGELELPGLGILSTINGELSFTEQKNSTTSFDYFALPSISAVSPIPQPETTNLTSSQTENDSIKLIDTIEPDEQGSHPIELKQENIQVTDEEEKISIESVPDIDEEAPIESPEVIEQPVSDESIDEVSSTGDNEIEIESDKNSIEELTESTNEMRSDDTVLTNEQQFDSSTLVETNVTSDAITHSEKPELSTSENSDDSEVFDEITDIYTLQQTKVVQDPANQLPNEIGENTTTWDFSESESDVHLANTEGLTEQAEIEPQKKSIPWYQKISLFALVLAAIAGIAYLFEPQAFNQFKSDTSQSDDKMPIPISVPELPTETDSLSFADSIMKSAQKVGIEIEPAKDTLKVSTDSRTPTSIYSYDIIAAAFAKDSEVNEYIAKMKKKGFEAKVANMPGKLFKKISIASFNSLDSAQSNLPRLRKQLKNDKIYIQKIKNN